MAVTSSNGYWYYEWRINGQKIRRSAGYKVDEISREALKEKEAEVKAKVIKELQSQNQNSSGSDTSKNKSRYRFLEAVDMLYESHWSRKDEGYRVPRMAKRIVKIIGNKYLDEINGAVIQELRRALIKQGYANGTINNYMNIVSKVLTTAHKEWEVLDKVPFIPRESTAGNARVRVITEEEEERLLQAAERLGLYEMRDLFIVLMDTGLRLGEAINLSYAANIDFENETITIWENRMHNKRQKNDKAKTIPMTTRVKEVLWRYKEHRKPFPTIHNNRSAYHYFRKILKEAGIPPHDIVLHSFRHTFAARLLKKDVSIYDVKQLLGHSSVVTTERYYAHLAVSKLKQSITVLEKEEDKGQTTGTDTPTNDEFMGTTKPPLIRPLAGSYRRGVTRKKVTLIQALR